MRIAVVIHAPGKQERTRFGSFDDKAFAAVAGEFKPLLQVGSASKDARKVSHSTSRSNLVKPCFGAPFSRKTRSWQPKSVASSRVSRPETDRRCSRMPSFNR